MLIKPFGDRALHVEVDADHPFAALSLAHFLDTFTFPGLLDRVPALDHVLLIFDPYQTSVQLLTIQLEHVLSIYIPAPLPAPQHHSIPVTYTGPDLDHVAQACNLRIAELIEVHSSPTYTVIMLGFLPGFPYLVGLPPVLHQPRRATPRTHVAAGSVAIAAEYTGIYPQASPGGWHILGTTPLRLFDPSHDPPTLLQPGDQVRFQPV